ncbi:MAG: dihydrodipicolinate reductase [Rhodoferax sp.]|nr:dihydrodipicolinate reductase [Rhodoferax sp.]
MIRIGLFGFGKAGSAVAQILSTDPRFALCWIAKRTAHSKVQVLADREIPVVGFEETNFSNWLDTHPVDAIVDFSVPHSLMAYGEELRRREMMLVSAISAYTEFQLDYARSLGAYTRIMCSPNITLGINFLIMASRLLRSIAPFADVEILEQHFKEKSEVSGTAKKIAQSLELGSEKITSLRLGGIIGHHEVIFGFPYQTVRLTHDSIKREAFGTGAAFVLGELEKCGNGFYSFEDLLTKKLREQLSVP